MKEKFKASFIHLIISTIVIGLFYIFTLKVWYPAPFFQASGLLEILLILLFVDVVLGPLLTFIVFKKNKKSLVFDLTIIASIQISALAYGVITVYNGHPVYVAFTVDRFTLVTANEVNPKNAKYDEFKVSTLGKPKLVYAKPPEDRETKNKLLFESIEGGLDLQNFSEFYEPIENFTDKIIERSISPELLLAHSDSRKKLEKFLAQENRNKEDFSYLPVMGKNKVMLLALNKKTNKPVDALDIDPWELGKNN